MRNLGALAAFVALTVWYVNDSELWLLAKTSSAPSNRRPIQQAINAQLRQCHYEGLMR
jgi:hypothetical protein